MNAAEQVEQVVKLASPKQVRFLEALGQRAEVEFEKPVEEMSVREASEKIDELLQKLGLSNGQGRNGYQRKSMKVDVGREWKRVEVEMTRIP